MITIQLSIFDFTGTLLEDVKADESTFDITITHQPGRGVMGFECFDVTGDAVKVQAFLDFYELEPDDAEATT